MYKGISTIPFFYIICMDKSTPKTTNRCNSA